MARLIDLTGAVGNVVLTPVTTLGRAPDNAMVLLDEQVSSHHAVIRADGGAFIVEDLSSTNGLFVARNRVQRAQLRHGDEIRLGRSVFRFDDEPPVAQPPQPTKLRAIDETKLRLFEDGLVPADQMPGTVTQVYKANAELNEQALRRDYERLRAVYSLITAVAADDPSDTILARVAETAISVFGADRAVVFTTHPSTGALVPRAARRKDEVQEDVSVSQSILRYVVGHKTAVLCGDSRTDERFSKAQSMIIGNVRSAMTVPMIRQDRLIGVIHMDTSGIARVFSRRDLEVSSAMAAQAAVLLESRLFEEQLRTADARRLAAMRDLIGGASHFINNPLAVLCANLGFLLEGAETLQRFHRQLPPVAQTAMTREIQAVDEDLPVLCRESTAAAERIQKVIVAMRMFDSAGAAGFRALDLGELVMSTLHPLRAELAALARFDVRVVAAVVVGDRERLTFVVQELVRNAAAAIPPGNAAANVIAMAVAVTGNTVRLVCEDSGCGIPEANREKVFTPFFTGSRDGRLGLGLAICAETCREHRGQISTAPRPGGGTAVTVELPLMPPADPSRHSL